MERNLKVACERFFKQMLTLSPRLGPETLASRGISWRFVAVRERLRLMFIFQAKIIGHYAPRRAMSLASLALKEPAKKRIYDHICGHLDDNLVRTIEAW